MNVKNRKCIRKLSLKSLYANRRRNLIAIFAIALTTLLFTSMFTIVLSLNASYETYQFRQVGGYAHGTFKDVSPEQAERIAAHPKVKSAGARKVIGITADGVFSKTPAEISYMDANCTKWSYATPTTGRMPESGKEVAMDTAALQLLGVTPELGAEVTVSYSITDKDQTAFTVTDTFTLVGYWDYDELMPVHYINISRDYADDIEAQAVKTGLQPFRTDLNVMMASSTNIQGQMEQVLPHQPFFIAAFKRYSSSCGQIHRSRRSDRIPGWRRRDPGSGCPRRRPSRRRRAQDGPSACRGPWRSSGP